MEAERGRGGIVTIDASNHEHTYRAWRDPHGDLWLVHLTWVVIDGRYECVGLELKSAVTEAELEKVELPDEPVPQDITTKRLTSDVLRRFPYGREVALHREEAGQELQVTPIEWGTSAGVTVPDSGSPEAWHKPGPGRPPDYDVDHWREVAKTYLEAYGQGKPPTRAVAKKYQRAISTASTWVGKCRELGLLPPTERGRARGASR